MGFFLPVTTLWWREVVRFYRQRSRLIGALGTPLVFWLLIGSGIGASFRPLSAPSGMDYLEYFYPGAMILIVLFTAIFSTISIIEDRREGFLLSVLVAPIPRSSLVLGKILGGTTIALMQGWIFILLAPLVGISLSLFKIALLTVILFLIGFSLTGLGFSMAWQIDSTQGFHSLMSLFLMPMWLLSGALFPYSGASSWVRWIMKANPLTYGAAALRRALYWETPPADPEFPSLAVSLLVTAFFGLAAFVASLRFARRRSVGGLG